MYTDWQVIWTSEQVHTAYVAIKSPVLEDGILVNRF